MLDSKKSEANGNVHHHQVDRLRGQIMQLQYRVLMFVTFTCLTFSASADENNVADPLFQDDQLLHLNITAPLITLVRKRPKDDYLPGQIEYTESDGNVVKLDLEIRTRGHNRHENCDYPPLLLNFKKKQTIGTIFANQNKLKLVVHCKKSEKYEQAVLREYLVYRIFNAVTDMSFRVRLVRVKYINSEKSGKEQERYAFLIEHKNRLGARFGLNDLKVEKTTVASIQPDSLNLSSVFAFLIGNTDFSPVAGAPNDECCHNYVLFGTDTNTDPIVAIPYDFDQSGFVDAPYALANEMFRIRTVRQRVYRGRCANNEHLEASLKRFSDRRDVIYKLVVEQEGLEPRVRKKLSAYIEDFYELIDDPKDVERKIIEECV